MRHREDLEKIFGPKGALEAFQEARDKGLVRFLGITGHHDPGILLSCIERFNFDTVLIPVNPAEPAYKSFIDEVIPVARYKGMGIVGMKIYFRGFATKLPGLTSLEPFYRYALSQPITTAVIGCDDIEQLRENIRLATSFKVLNSLYLKQLEKRI